MSDGMMREAGGGEGGFLEGEMRGGWGREGEGRGGGGGGGGGGGWGEGER